MFDMSPATDASVFETATHHYRYEMNLPVSADTVWAGFVADRPLAWCRSLSGRYTSSRPFGVGTTREVGVTANLIKLRERFFIWDETKRRHAFYVVQSNLPLFSMFAEDYQVTPTADGCRFVWQFAMEPRKGFGAAVALTQPLFKSMLLDPLVSDTKRHFNANA